MVSKNIIVNFYCHCKIVANLSRNIGNCFGECEFHLGWGITGFPYLLFETMLGNSVNYKITSIRSLIKYKSINIIIIIAYVVGI